MTGRPAAGPRPAPNPPGLGEGPGIAGDLLDYVLQAGARAPSWNNCQPWRFRTDGDRIAVRLDPPADPSIADWENLNSVIACGAAVENMVVAGNGRGLAMSVRACPDPTDPALMAVVDVARRAGAPLPPGGWGHPLEEAVWRRHTNTLMFDESPLEQGMLDALRASVGDFPRVSVHLVSNPAQRRQVFLAASAAEQAGFSRRDLHEQFHRMIRWTDAEAERDRTGYTLPSIGACRVGETFFRVTRPWPVMWLMNLFGADRSQGRRASLGLLHCSAVGLLTLEGGANVDVLAAGRVLERLWLTATRLGLDLQPHAILTLFHRIWCQGGRELFSRKHQVVLAEAFRLYRGAFTDTDLDDGQGIFLFRVGRGQPVGGYTQRRVLR